MSQGWRAEHKRREALADAEHRKLDERFAVSQAENVVAAARSAELLDQQKTARRRVSAARGRLTKAKKDGGAEKIRAARQQLEQAERDFDQASDTAIRETLKISQARNAELDGHFRQMKRAWSASDAVIENLRAPRDD
ncbi:hypothetical protein DI005_06530 [Prauserella sp. PE36]|uniref:hypothetical protein n=1 Tax=Prauserella sp. PE36 TaxID=1504709 RepID=UPI000DE4F8E7|nr:hypothetical protein [Prauserella sp. PE36]RBM22471.1 hypothetical protein DI005_06530 [Prauserella sp. PE36]